MPLPTIEASESADVAMWRPIARRFMSRCRGRWESYEGREGVGRELVGWATERCEDTAATLTARASEASCHAVALELGRQERSGRAAADPVEVLREVCLGSSSPLSDLTRARYLASLPSPQSARMLAHVVDAPPALGLFRGHVVSRSPTTDELRAVVRGLEDEAALLRWRAAAWERAETSPDPYVRAAVWMQRARESSRDAPAVAQVRALLCDTSVPEVLRRYVAQADWHEGFDGLDAIIDPCQGGEACDTTEPIECPS